MGHHLAGYFGVTPRSFRIGATFCASIALATFAIYPVASNMACWIYQHLRHTSGIFMGYSWDMFGIFMGYLWQDTLFIAIYRWFCQKAPLKHGISQPCWMTPKVGGEGGIPLRPGRQQWTEPRPCGSLGRAGANDPRLSLQWVYRLHSGFPDGKG